MRTVAPNISFSRNKLNRPELMLKLKWYAEDSEVEKVYAVEYDCPNEILCIEEFLQNDRYHLVYLIWVRGLSRFDLKDMLELGLYHISKELGYVVLVSDKDLEKFTRLMIEKRIEIGHEDKEYQKHEYKEKQTYSYEDPF